MKRHCKGFLRRTSCGMGIWLNVMHVVVAGTVVYCFGRFTTKA